MAPILEKHVVCVQPLRQHNVFLNKTLPLVDNRILVKQLTSHAPSSDQVFDRRHGDENSSAVMVRFEVAALDAVADGFCAHTQQLRGFGDR